MKAIALQLRPPAGAAPAIRSIVAHEFRYDLRTYWRNRQSVFFTLAMPVMFLLIFASVFGHGKVASAGFSMSEAVYYVPGIMAMGV